MYNTLPLHERLALHAVATSKWTPIYRLLGLADMSRRMMEEANAAEPYDHRIYTAWERLLTVYLRRLLGANLAEKVQEVVYDTGCRPTYAIRKMIK